MKVNLDKEWLVRRAEQEEGVEVSATSDRPSPPTAPPAESEDDDGRIEGTQYQMALEDGREFMFPGEPFTAPPAESVEDALENRAKAFIDRVYERDGEGLLDAGELTEFVEAEIQRQTPAILEIRKLLGSIRYEANYAAGPFRTADEIDFHMAKVRQYADELEAKFVQTVKARRSGGEGKCLK